MGDCLLGHHFPHFAFSTWVSNHGCTTTQDGYRTVSCPLHMGHGHHRQHMPNMQTICGWIETSIKSDLFFGKQFEKRFLVSCLFNKSPFLQNLKYRHGNSSQFRIQNTEARIHEICQTGLVKIHRSVEPSVNKKIQFENRFKFVVWLKTISCSGY